MDIITNSSQTIKTELFTRWTNYMDVSNSSITTYNNKIKIFINYLQSKGITNPTRQDILSFKKELETKNYKPTYINSIIISIKQFFKWTETEHIYENIAQNIKSNKISKDFKKDYLQPEQAKNLLNSIDRTTKSGIRDYAIICLLLTTGLRTVEVVRASIDDVRLNNTVLYIQGKGRTDKNEYVKLAPQTAKALQEYLNTRKIDNTNKPLFCSDSNRNTSKPMTTRSISRIVKNHLINAGLNSARLTAHSLRHTTATLNLKAGGTLAETQQLLRHKNINTTMIYSHIIDREKNNSEQRVADTIFNN